MDPTIKQWLGSKVRHRAVRVGDIHLHVAEAGVGDRIVILLHGFPEMWVAWRWQMKALTEAGYHVVVPDMRGFGESDKPEGVASYRMDVLAEDVAGLIRALGVERANVVGHDWGGTIAWAFAMMHPELLTKVASVCGPLPIYMAEVLQAKNLLKHWYFFMFQLSNVPEKALSRKDFLGIKRTFTGDTIRKDAYSNELLSLYAKAASQNGALTAMLNYYRALRGIPQDTLDAMSKPVKAPVLIVLAEKDKYVSYKAAVPSPEIADHPEVVTIKDTSHWVLSEKPQEVGKALVDFLSR